MQIFNLARLVEQVEPFAGEIMIEIKDMASIILEGLKQDECIESVVMFMNEKSLQVRTTDGAIFNIGVVKTQHKINREPVYERKLT